MPRQMFQPEIALLIATCTAFSALGAFLSTSASIFINVGLDFTGIRRKLIYIVVGTIVGLIFDNLFDSIDFYYCLALGAWWVYVPKALRATLQSFLSNGTTNG